MFDKFLELVILLLFLIGPLAFPLFSKKWTWFITMAIGYAVYMLWGVYLHFTSDVKEYGTGYGLLIVPYLIVLSIIGITLQLFRRESSQKER